MAAEISDAEWSASRNDALESAVRQGVQYGPEDSYGGAYTAALATAACNTVRGAARDVNSVANCTENTMKGGNC